MFLPLIARYICECKLNGRPASHPLNAKRGGGVPPPRLVSAIQLIYAVAPRPTSRRKKPPISPFSQDTSNGTALKMEE